GPRDGRGRPLALFPEHLRAGDRRDAPRGRPRSAPGHPLGGLPRHVGGPAHAGRLGLRDRDSGVLARADAPVAPGPRARHRPARRSARPDDGAAAAGDSSPVRRRAAGRAVAGPRRRARPRGPADRHPVLPGAGRDRAGESRRDAGDGQGGLHRQCAGAGGVGAQDRGAVRGGGREDPGRGAAARELRFYARVFARSAASLLGLGLVLVFLLMAALGPFIVPYPEDARGAVHLDQKLRPPSARHWFGTDEVGTDIYTRVVLGARVSLQIGLVITVLGAAIGVPLGIVAGYVGGAVGETIMRVTDI